MTNQKRKMLVTSALPYANGSLHIGHLVEHIQSDIWVRYQNLIGNDCIFVCGDDAHGTPIMLKAAAQGITPEELIAKYQIEHQQDLKEFLINYQSYYTTHSPENRALASEIYAKLKKNGDIISQEIEQAFDPEKNMFLPDRFIKGECPKCHAQDQYGDGCEKCGAHYSPTELLNPRSAISGATPIKKTSEHFFFKLDNYKEILEKWTRAGHLQNEIANKLDEWFTDGLKSWDISRDAPYFGFEIPDAPGKYFYVWLDAPIGYMASFKKLCSERKDLDFDEYWGKDSKCELYHFIGKDIVYFHALFWPAMLIGSGYRAPTQVLVHGFLTVNGAKMSKSRGTFITGRQYLNHLQPEYLRYYFASKLTDTIEDIDLNFDDFIARINSDMIGKFVNIASRSAGFINKSFGHKLSTQLDAKDMALFNDFVQQGAMIAEAYAERSYAKAMRDIMNLADQVNRYIDDHKPWVLIKDTLLHPQVQAISTLSLNLFKILMTYLKPVLPVMAEMVEDFLQVKLTWENRGQVLLNHEIKEFKPLMQRVDPKQVEKMLEENSETSETITAAAVSIEVKATHLAAEPIKPNISIDDFVKIDLRIAKIVNAEAVPEADKLLKLTLDLGGETRTVFAGIKAAYDPADLIGKNTVMVANLEPRKMRFGMSEGMVLAAGPGGEDLWILEPHDGAEPGMRVK
jgi:methionyl-tRNA synthetase